MARAEDSRGGSAKLEEGQVACAVIIEFRNKVWGCWDAPQSRLKTVRSLAQPKRRNVPARDRPRAFVISFDDPLVPGARIPALTGPPAGLEPTLGINRNYPNFFGGGFTVGPV